MFSIVGEDDILDLLSREGCNMPANVVVVLGASAI